MRSQQNCAMGPSENPPDRKHVPLPPAHGPAGISWPLFQGTAATLFLSTSEVEARAGRALRNLALVYSLPRPVSQPLGSRPV